MTGHVLKVQLDAANRHLRDTLTLTTQLRYALQRAKAQNQALWDAVEHLIDTGGHCMPGRVTPTNHFDGMPHGHEGCQPCQQVADLIHTRGTPT